MQSLSKNYSDFLNSLIKNELKIQSLDFDENNLPTSIVKITKELIISYLESKFKEEHKGVKRFQEINKEF